jgi:hypothetical protein
MRGRLVVPEAEEREQESVRGKTSIWHSVSARRRSVLVRSKRPVIDLSGVLAYLHICAQRHWYAKAARYRLSVTIL